MVELLEDAGVPALSIAIAEAANGSMKLGSVLAKAVQVCLQFPTDAPLE